MPSSQLTRLKASLREQGVIGPQKSKKQKRQLSRNPAGGDEKRLGRSAALENIREQFNPFDLKHNARGPKFEVTTSRPLAGAAAKGIRGQPGVSKSRAEERRRQTLMAEMQRRHKVGGLQDRRMGEYNPNMAAEEKILERFAKAKQRHGRRSVFNLEDGEPGEELTHMGKALDLDSPPILDDYHQDDAGPDALSDAGTDDGIDDRKQLKRMRATGYDTPDERDHGETLGQPARKKTKREVMDEVMVKSKQHKAERQAEKDADEDLRAQIDKELPQIQALIMDDRRVSNVLPPSKNPVSKIAGRDKAEFDQDYDRRVRELGADQRARPAERTKTEQEKAKDRAETLLALEQDRIRRMAGEAEPDNEKDKEDDGEQDKVADGVTILEKEDDDHFGLGKGIKTLSTTAALGFHDDDLLIEQDLVPGDEKLGLGKGIVKILPTATELGFDDEDDFLIEEDLVASGSDLDELDADMEGDGSGEEDELHDDGDDEFVAELSSDMKVLLTQPGQDGGGRAGLKNVDSDGVPLTFECPQSLDQLIEITNMHQARHIPTIIQRIRASTHPRLDSSHKEKLGRFATCLVDYVALAHPPPFGILESVIRHIHSLAKSYPIQIGQRLRGHIGEIGQGEDLHVGRLAILTAVGAIFPTSDHFHQVVTPAMLTIGRLLGQKVPHTVADYAAGTYLATLAVQYQALSKRYIPELVSFCLNTLLAMAPLATSKKMGDFPVHEPATGIRIRNARAASVRRLRPEDCVDRDTSPAETASCKVSLVHAITLILEAAAEMWIGKAALLESLTPAVAVCQHLNTKTSREHLPDSLGRDIERLATKLSRVIQAARLSRRPLELHHHRPLAIKTCVPKFEAGFDPDKHYDPDRDRADATRLRKEYKRERKDMMRELRRDSAFTAREKLKIKKAKDEAYERKYSKIVAEIQNEAGRETNEYEREKKARLRANKRK